MKISNHYGNDVSFSAIMSLKNFRGSTERLKNIAKLFEQKTKNYTHDIVEISGNPAQGSSIELYHHTKGCDEHFCSIPARQITPLFQKTDNAIADKLAKLFRMFKRQDKDYEIANKFMERMQRRDLYDDASNFEPNFWEILFTKSTKDLQISMSKDPVLKNFVMQ